MGQLEIQDTFTPYFDPEKEIEGTIRVERREIRRLRAKRSLIVAGLKTSAPVERPASLKESPPRT